MPSTLRPSCPRLALAVALVLAGCGGGSSGGGTPDDVWVPIDLQVDLLDVRYGDPGRDPGPGDEAGADGPADPGGDAGDAEDAPGPADADPDASDPAPDPGDDPGTDPGADPGTDPGIDPGVDVPDDGPGPDAGPLCIPGDAKCKCTSDADCDPAYTGTCGANVCKTSYGICQLVSAGTDGLPCDDHDVCTTDTTCKWGRCLGIALDCDDGLPCTSDRCDPVQGCVHEPAGGGCEDGNLCTAPDTCEGSTCVPGPAVACDDHDPCTDDSCAPSAGCMHLPATGPACDDLDPCTGDDACWNGACVGGKDVCSAPCTLEKPLACGGTVEGDTTGATNALASYGPLPCLSLFSDAGPERVYPFTATDRVRADVTLQTHGGDLDVFVLGTNCDAGSCRAQALGVLGFSTHTVFDPVPGTPYYLTVDGRGAGTPFTLSVACLEADCGDGADNDGDGSTDCTDADCGGTTVTCGGSTSAKIGSFSHAGSYAAACGGGSGSDDDGVHRLVLDGAATVTVTATASAKGDTYRIFALAGGCTGAACVAASSSSSGTATLAFPASAGTYHLVVEETATGSDTSHGYQLSVACTSL